ncbi:4Fe-4S single cluster domain-containing protein [soil metagenome]
MNLAIAQIVPVTEAEGPGRRFALWFQGCPLRCPGCCNPEFLPFNGGHQIEVETIIEQIAIANRDHSIEGISLLGGEPFAQSEGATVLATAARAMNLGVMIYSGYTLAELKAMPDPAVAMLLGNTDLLVDGPYLREQPEANRRWIGSANQRVHFLSNRYDPADPCWTKSNTLEIRVRGSEVTVNGFPAKAATGLWKRVTSP